MWNALIRWSLQNRVAVLGVAGLLLLHGTWTALRMDVDVLPERFRGYGARCHHEGSKAVLVAETPSDVSLGDLKELQAALDQSQDELRRRAEAAEAAGAGAGAVGAAAVASAVGVALWGYGLAGLIAWAIKKYLSARKRRQEYSKLQYDYLLARFLVEEFEAYVTGIEGR